MKKILMFLFIFSLLLVGCGNSNVIKTYTRDTSSGTRDCFFSTIGLKDAVNDSSYLVDGTIEVEKNDDMINYIENDINGIGYISLATYDSSVVRGLNYEGVEATEENVLNGTYSFMRNFNFIIRTEFMSESEEEIVKAFVKYMTTKEGKATIKSKDGIVAITASDPNWEDIKDQYPVCKMDNSNITIKFGGSTSVSKMVKALADEFSKKCGNFIVEQNHTGSGDAYKRTQGSEKDGANYLSIGFASREFKETEEAQANTTGTICIDAVVVIVNKTNSTISDITSKSLKSIYEGNIKSWKDLE